MRIVVNDIVDTNNAFHSKITLRKLLKIQVTVNFFVSLDLGCDKMPFEIWQGLRIFWNGDAFWETCLSLIHSVHPNTCSYLWIQGGFICFGGVIVPLIAVDKR